MSKIHTYSTRPTSIRDQYALAYQCARRNSPMMLGSLYHPYAQECEYYDIPAIVINKAYDSYRNRHAAIVSSSLLDSVYARLVDRYASEIRQAFNWNYLQSEARSSLEENLELWGESEGAVYLGSVFSLYPSGKYTHYFSTNDNDLEAVKDSAYCEALDRIAEEYGGYIESSEGDPTDILFMVSN